MIVEEVVVVTTEVEAIEDRALVLEVHVKEVPVLAVTEEIEEDKQKKTHFLSGFFLILLLNSEVFSLGTLIL